MIRSRIGLVAMAMVLFPFASGASAASPEAYAAALADRSPAVVTIKFTLRVSGGQFGEDEQEGETTGFLISSDGLVLCSSTQIGGFANLYRAMGMPVDFTITPDKVRVLIGNDVEGVEATVIARDSELDLAWVKITEPREEAYPHIDVAQTATASPGDEILAIARLPEFYGRSHVIIGGRIAGETTKPRRYMVPSQELGAEAGLPVLTGDDAAFLGMLVLVTPEAEDLGADAGMERVQEMIGVFVLPAAEVAKATARARETAGVE
ncbi:MAG: trypsin-like peptidase domain-containing protein [Phycisphaerales bacterium]